MNMPIRITGVEMHVLDCKSKEFKPVLLVVGGGYCSVTHKLHFVSAVKILTVVSHFTSTVALQVRKHF